MADPRTVAGRRAPAPRPSRRRTSRVVRRRRTVAALTLIVGAVLVFVLSSGSSGHRTVSAGRGKTPTTRTLASAVPRVQLVAARAGWQLASPRLARRRIRRRQRHRACGRPRQRTEHPVDRRPYRCEQRRGDRGRLVDGAGPRRGRWRHRRAALRVRRRSAARQRRGAGAAAQRPVDGRRTPPATARRPRGGDDRLERVPRRWLRRNQRDARGSRNVGRHPVPHGRAAAGRRPVSRRSRRSATRSSSSAASSAEASRAPCRRSTCAPGARE